MLQEKVRVHEIGGSSNYIYIYTSLSSSSSSSAMLAVVSSIVLSSSLSFHLFITHFARDLKYKFFVVCVARAARWFKSLWFLLAPKTAMCFFSFGLYLIGSSSLAFLLCAHCVNFCRSYCAHTIVHSQNDFISLKLSFALPPSLAGKLPANAYHIQIG